MNSSQPLVGAGVVRLVADSKDPLHRQVYNGIRRAILAGDLVRGSPLPASRNLAEQLNVSRTTIVVAYEQLLAEGYLTARIGSGTSVSLQLPDDKRLREVPDPRRGVQGTVGADTGRLSRRGQQMQDLKAGGRTNYPKRPSLFTLGVPALDEFPLELWRKLCRDRARKLSPVELTYQDTSGWWPLREAIANYTASFRGVQCGAEQVFITSGAQQALDLTSRLLLDPGDSVLFEDPGYWRARAAFQGNGAQIIALPVDTKGADVNATSASASNARIVYVTPSHQFPLGVTMTIERRLELLDWAHRNDAVVIEDDYDSVYRYAHHPIPSLQGLDNSQRTIYVGSLSKLLFPAANVGYVIVPRSLTSAYEAALRYVGRPPALFMQTVICDFIAGGHFQRHVRRMRKVHQARRTALVESIERSLGDKLEIIGAEAGLHCTTRILTRHRDTTLARRIADLGYYVQPLSADALMDPPTHSGLVFGFGCGTPSEISTAVDRIATVFGVR